MLRSFSASQHQEREQLCELFMQLLNLVVAKSEVQTKQGAGTVQLFMSRSESINSLAAFVRLERRTPMLTGRPLEALCSSAEQFSLTEQLLARRRQLITLLLWFRRLRCLVCPWHSGRR